MYVMYMYVSSMKKYSYHNLQLKGFNKDHFKFYTGFENYELFKVVVKFLEPEIYSLNYWGSISIIADDLNETSSPKTRGRSRMLNVEEEFFMVLV